MIPIKARILCQPTAEKTGHSQELVDAIVSFYWSELKSAMIEGKAHNIKAYNFGTFCARPQKVKETLDKYNGQLQHIKPTTFSKCQIINEIEKRVKKLEGIQEMIHEDELKKEQIKKKRNVTDEDDMEE